MTTRRRRRFAALVTPAFPAMLAGCAADRVLAPLPPLADLPADLAAITFSAHGRTTLPYTMLELRHADGFRGFVAVDDAGRPVWFFRTQGSPFSFTRRANGNFVLLDSARGLLEVTPSGHVVGELPQQDRPGRRIHHDVTATPRNTILFIAEDWRPHDGTLVNGEAIWEWTPETGVTELRWSSFDHLSPVHDRGIRSRDDDWLHANSIAIAGGGVVLLSLHFLDQVVALAPDLSRMEWRLGGINASIAVADAFSGQHTAQQVAAGRVLLFDNGFDREDARYSRAVEYELHDSAATAAWEWRPARDNWARVISSARRLPNGNTLVGFGTPEGMPAGATGPIEVYEVTRDGVVVWHMTVGGAVSSMYRATPIASF
jgi:hypothetical protein